MPDDLPPPAGNARVEKQPAWQTAVGALTAPGAASLGGSGREGAETPMALQFELREQTPRTRDRWRGATAQTATPESDPNAEYRLGMRPVVLSSAGNWVRASVSWNSLGYQTNRLSLKVDQQRWFAQVAALHRAIREVYAGQDGDWLYLDNYQSPLLWPLLDEAATLGIALVGSSKDAVVTVGERARLSLDAIRGSAAELRLDATLAIDGRSHPPEFAGAIGTHGIYSYRLTPRTVFTLAPTTMPLSDEQRRLLGAPSTMIVPASDVETFLAEWYPVLHRGIEVTSTDDSVQFPEAEPPILVLTAAFRPKDALDLAWHWEVREGALVTRMPLGPQLHGNVLDAAGLLAPLEDATLHGLETAEFTDKTLPRLLRLPGLRVDVIGDRPDYRELTETPRLVFKTVATDRRDWFDLGVYVTIDGHDVPFGPLFKALVKGRKKLLLIDRSYLSLEQPVFDRLKELIEEANVLPEWETGVRISRYQASLWADFEDLADETEEAQAWRDAVAALLRTDGIEATPLPSGLLATLRPYQLDGFAWLALLWKHRLGGILADDMGLGKTVQALALISHAVETESTRSRPFLVVAPTSVVSNWLAEAAKFTPGLAVRGVTATETKSGLRLADVAAGSDIVVTSYALFRLDFDAYQTEDWAGLILDEAQFVKNSSSRTHECARDLNVPFTLAITGTPMENSLTDLWSLFAIVAPGLFPSSRRFAEEYLRPIAAGEQPELLSRLRRRIRPLMMRRSKELVATELPAKQEQVLHVELDPQHQKLYDTFLQRERQKLLGLVEDLDRNRFIVFRSLTLLRLLALDASLVDDAYAGIPSGKLDALFDQLEDVVAEGHRALVFSQFTSFLKKAAARLDAEGIAYEYLDGSTLKRPEVIARFTGGVAPVFLISLKAGGFGLNLTQADYVFLLDPWWNPASENQAIDRTHRIGQTRSVNVYRLVAAGTIEEKVMALKERKAKLFTAVMDDDAMFSSALTADDIRGLLS